MALSIKIDPKYDFTQVKNYINAFLYPVLTDIVISYYKISYHWIYENKTEDKNRCIIMNNKIIYIYKKRYIGCLIGLDTNNDIIVDTYIDIKQIFNDSSCIYLLTNDDIKIIHYEKKIISTLRSDVPSILKNTLYINNKNIYTQNLYLKKNTDLYCDSIKYSIKDINIYFDNMTEQFFTNSNYLSSYDKYTIMSMLVDKNNDIVVALNANKFKLCTTKLDDQKIWIVNDYLVQIVYCDEWSIMYTYDNHIHNNYVRQIRTTLVCVDKLDGKINKSNLDAIYNVHVDNNTLVLTNKHSYIYRLAVFGEKN